MRTYTCDVHDITSEPKLTTDPIKWEEWFRTADRVLHKSKVGGWDVFLETVFTGVEEDDSLGLPLLWQLHITGMDLVESWIGRVLDANRYQGVKSASRDAAFTWHKRAQDSLSIDYVEYLKAEEIASRHRLVDADAIASVRYALHVKKREDKEPTSSFLDALEEID